MLVVTSTPLKVYRADALHHRVGGGDKVRPKITVDEKRKETADRVVQGTTPIERHPCIRASLTTN